MTSGRSLIGSGTSSGPGIPSLSQTSAKGAFLLLSVDLLDSGLAAGRPSASKLSVLPCMLRGGVRGDARCGRSVGRRAAGMYMGDLGVRDWRFARGREVRAEGEMGEIFVGGVGVGVVEDEEGSIEA